MAETAHDPRVALLLRALDQAFDKRSWHGTNLRGALRGVKAEAAAWRPAPGRHNVWELTLHCAYWKYAVYRPILGLVRGSFPVTGSNWFDRPEGEPSERAWKADLGVLLDCHRQLRAMVEDLDPADLERPPPGGKTPILDLIVGVTAHDLHHTGQIQYLKRLYKDRSP